jgi:hypothetical protein
MYLFRIAASVTVAALLVIATPVSAEPQGLTIPSRQGPGAATPPSKPSGGGAANSPRPSGSGSGSTTSGSGSTTSGSGSTTAAQSNTKPDPNAPKLADLTALLSAARQLGVDAVTLKNEAVAGKIRDRSETAEKPAPAPAPTGTDTAVEPPPEKWIVLTEEERKARFEEAKKKFDEADKKVKTVQEAQRKAPAVISAEAVANTVKVLNSQHALTLVAEASFRKAHKIGALADWQRLCSQALTLDKDCTAAQNLDKQLKELADKEKTAAQHKK